MFASHVRGENRSFKKRNRYEFKAIKQSSAFEAIGALPELACSKQLAQDAIFRVVHEELKQVKCDVDHIHECLMEDISSETAQTDRIEHQLQVSMEKLQRHYKKVTRKRAKHELTTEREIEGCVSVTKEIEDSLSVLKNKADSLVLKAAQKDSELPYKTRLLNDYDVNRRHYHLLFEAVSKLSDKTHLGDAEATDILEVDGPQPSSFGEDEALADRNMGISELDMTSHPDYLETSRKTSKSLSQYEAPSTLRATTATCGVLLMPKFQKISSPSVSTSYEVADMSHSIKKIGDLSDSLHGHLNISN